MLVCVMNHTAPIFDCATALTRCILHKLLG